MLCYLGVPFISALSPAAVWLVRARGSAFVRQHARQALNLAITLVLYNCCAAILAGVLALDTVGVALAIALPVTLALWLIALAHLARAARAASRGEFRELPAWLCATLVR
jgi:uncharacterized Tic20 family protein